MNSPAVRVICPFSSRLQTVARHEAGHAAAAALLCWTVVDLELNASGGGSCDFVAPNGLARSKRLEQHAIIALSARAYAADDVDGELTDRLEASALIRELASRKRLPVDWLDRRLRQQVADLVASREFLWLASYLGDALMQRGRLDYSEIQETIREAERDCREGRMRRLERGEDGLE